jgi:hypothetical protein
MYVFPFMLGLLFVDFYPVGFGKRPYLVHAFHADVPEPADLPDGDATQV